MTPDCPDPDEQRDRFADLQREAGVSTKRCIDVHDGKKKSTDHTQREPDDVDPDALADGVGGEGA